MQEIKGRLVDLDAREIYGAVVTVGEDGRITDIRREPERDRRGWYILPGFVDAHVHIESSLLLPVEFAKLAVVHGTVATVSDPHEIANVLGRAGVDYLLDNARRTPLSINFGAPSCVPATNCEAAGAVLDSEAVADLLAQHDIRYLSEVMNYPGVLNGEAEVLAKIAAARRLGKPVDGHAPGLRGARAAAYAAAGITTDHECTSAGEARDKLAAGMKVIIREGSAARNYDALHELIDEFPDQLMFCTDDCHPDDLLGGHINRLVTRAVRGGHDLFNVLRIACRNPVDHYGLDVGRLRVGDRADLIQVDDLRHFGVMTTYLNGRLAAEAGAHLLPSYRPEPINNFRATPKSPDDFRAPPPPPGATRIRVIGVTDGEITTEARELTPVTDADGRPVSAPERDLVKLAVINRYAPEAPVAVGFAHGTGLQRGALASSVAHDSHNIVVLGVDDDEMARVANAVIGARGGLAAGRDEYLELLPLPVAGIISAERGPLVAARYQELSGFVRRKLRCGLTAPFMTLSFLALLVIPSLKLSDRGLFDGVAFRPVNLWIDG